MLSVNTKSLHYRWNRWFWGLIGTWNRPNDLCSYFWLTVISPFVAICLIFCLGFAAYLTAIYLFGPLYWAINIWFFDLAWLDDVCTLSKNKDNLDCVPESLYYWVWFPWFLVTAQVTMWWIAWRKCYKDRDITPESIQSAVGVGWEYAKSTKENYCPLIKFED